MTKENKETIKLGSTADHEANVEQGYPRVSRYTGIIQACLSSAYQICSMYQQEGKPSDFDVTQVALAIYSKVTEGEERRELTSLFERVARWWMEREEKQAADAEASRAAFMEAMPAPPLLTPAPDPVFRGLRSVVNCLLDIVEDAALAKARDAGFAIGAAVSEEIRKQTGQEVTG